MPDLLTIGAITRQIGVARSKLDYAVQKVQIRERYRAGIIRLFSPDQIPSMRAALQTIRPVRQLTDTEGVCNHDAGDT